VRAAFTGKAKISWLVFRTESSRQTTSLSDVQIMIDFVDTFIAVTV